MVGLDRTSPLYEIQISMDGIKKRMGWVSVSLYFQEWTGIFPFICMSLTVDDT